MNPYSNAALEVMLSDLESDRVERKESFKGNAPQTVREAVCAFANDLAGHGEPGVVFIGARDDGAPAGVDVTDELLRQLADIKSDGNIAPPPTLLVEQRSLRSHDMAVVTVWPCDTPPVRFKGRIHVRWGPRRGLASAQDERILNERRRHRDRPFDIQPIADATLEDLDRLRFEQEYLPSVVARDVLVANERSHEQRLAATKMIVGEADAVPTVLGMLVVGKSPADWLPGAYTQFLRLAGDDLTAPYRMKKRSSAPSLISFAGWRKSSKLITFAACNSPIWPRNRVPKNIQWMLCANWCVMPSCIAVMRQRMRPCGCTGSMTVSRSTIPAARLAALRQKILDSRASPITATRISRKHYVPWALCNVSVLGSRLPARRWGND